MCKGWKQKLIIVGLLFVGAQFVRPGRANPPIDGSKTMRADAGAPGAVAPVLERSCGDCHSNHTAWPWYTRIAPLSWAMAHGVKEGRKALNISAWSSYSPATQQALLAASCRAVSSGKMPGGAWIMLHPEAKLSAQEIRAICAAARTREYTHAQ